VYRDIIIMGARQAGDGPPSGETRILALMTPAVSIGRR